MIHEPQQDCSPWLDEINWDMIHEDAVTMYLEWGNNNFYDDLRRPVTMSGEYSIYLVVDNWGDAPKLVLTKMNNYGSQALCEKVLPDDLARSFKESIGGARGVHEPTQEVKDWFKALYEKNEAC